MNRRHILAASLLLAFVAAATAFYISKTGNVAPIFHPREPKRDRWEYGELGHIFFSGEIKHDHLITWEGPDGARHEAKDYKALAEKMRIKVEQADSIAILNVLGVDGWELVTHTIRNTDPTQYYHIQIWTLKRRK